MSGGGMAEVDEVAEGGEVVFGGGVTVGGVGWREAGADQDVGVMVGLDQVAGDADGALAGADVEGAEVWEGDGFDGGWINPSRAWESALSGSRLVVRG